MDVINDVAKTVNVDVSQKTKKYIGDEIFMTDEWTTGMNKIAGMLYEIIGKENSL
ncbi:hypothetical protein [Virgibacillus alimentarius]|uniref:Uncharacterized protein n=1 Tax=Virgibacillus alimentarius TaxID=698769 RepID=A0ABS4SBG5_9BACI|nr:MULTISPECIES: hypothetical protein [Virgibacillus]MBP2258852.1 hypothetical protein [Virgibacillus alimentarius]HLR67052.1 hypothetical protein [Virgibacillus sp.]